MLMDSVMTVLSFRREYLAMVGEMHMEKARLEAVVGKELDGMETGMKTPNGERP